MRPTHKEDLELPGNPCLLETVAVFLERQKILLSEAPEFKAEKYECRRCGDCCTWNYYALDVAADQKLLDQLYMLAKYPHGYWVVIQDKIILYMPFWSKNQNGILDFEGKLPDKHIEHLAKTDRMHGTWVLDKSNKILVYNPVPCVHIIKDGDLYACAIYEDRPQVCRDYTCGRYPL